MTQAAPRISVALGDNVVIRGGMNATRPTMRDVAVIAGVSLKTVSRVINGEASVTPATAERVTAAIAELGFERNDLAASLRHGRSSHTLGLVIEDVANPFYSVVAQAVEAAARERGFLLITTPPVRTPTASGSSSPRCCVDASTRC